MSTPPSSPSRAKYPYYRYKQTNTKAKGFHYDWAGFNRAVGKHPFGKKIRMHPFVYYGLFAFGMFVGFVIIMVTAGAVLMGVWPWFLMTFAVIGYMLVRDGWNGLTGNKHTFLKVLLGRISKKIFS